MRDGKSGSANRVSIGTTVARLRAEFPDISISSLRFLEQEGLLQPARTAGRHRLFSNEDIARIRLIKRLQQRHYTLAEIRAHLEKLDSLPLEDEGWRSLVELLLSGDREAAWRLVEQTLSEGGGIRQLYLYLFLPALREIGIRWQRGECTVAQEHLATGMVQDLMALAMSQAPAPPLNGVVAVAACPAGERHGLGLKMLGDLLTLEGWRVYYLGADVPAADIVAMVRAVGAAWLLLTLHTAEPYPGLEEVIELVRQEFPDQSVRIAIGGAACAAVDTPSLQPDLACVDLDQAVESLTGVAAKA